MAVRFTALGMAKWLELFVRQAATAHLYASGAGPDDLAELTGDGYAPFVVTGGRWDLALRGTLVTATYPELLWRFTAPVVAAGYYVANKDGKVLWWERFEGPSAGPVDLQALRLQVDVDTGTD